MHLSKNFLTISSLFTNLLPEYNTSMELCKNYKECVRCIYFEECGEKACIEKGRVGPGIPIATMFLIFYLIYLIV